MTERPFDVGDIWLRLPLYVLSELNVFFHLGGSKDICLTISLPHTFTTLNGRFLLGRLSPEEWLDDLPCTLD